MRLRACMWIFASLGLPLSACSSAGTATAANMVAGGGAPSAQPAGSGGSVALVAPGMPPAMAMVPQTTAAGGTRSLPPMAAQQPSSGGTGGAVQPMAATPQAGAAGSAGMSAAQAGTPAASGTAGAAPASGLPPLTDPGAKGPLEIQVVSTLEGLSTHILIAPKELGKDGIKHPIVVWINGAGANSSSYRNMLDNLASHGFFLLDDKQSNFESQPEVDAQRAAIDWVIAQADKAGGPYAGKLDTSRIAIAGHSLGSVSTFGNVKDTRIKTSIHMAGGLTGNPEGVNESWLQDLHAPSAFLVGDKDSNGLPRVKNDFAKAPASAPVFFGLLAGVSHTDEFSQPNGGRWGRIVLAWLRWQLASDESFASRFKGADCEFCKGDWMAMKRALD